MFGKKYDKIKFSLPNGARFGNAQIIGEAPRQNDYFIVADNKDSILAVAADGASERATGKYAAVIACEILKMNYINKMHEKKGGVKEYFGLSFNAVKERLNDNIYGNRVGCALLALVARGPCLYWASVGNCRLFLYRQKELKGLNDVSKHEPDFGGLKTQKKDIYMLCTNGAYRGLTEMEIMYELSKRGHPYTKAMELSKRIQNRGFIYQDNATIVVLDKLDKI
jgi:serine/threonine protein phosphatase PrpC